MVALDCPARLNIEPEILRSTFNQEPFGFTHSLSTLDILKFDNLQILAEKYAGINRDYYVAHSAKTPGTVFTSVPVAPFEPHEAMRRLNSGSYRVLLKRPEDYDPRFRDLLEDLFKQVAERLVGLVREDIARIEGGLLISSSATTTPFHFDPEVGFFSQIEGEKIYHLYSPSVVSEPELEAFYRSGRVSIAQVDLEGREPSREHVFPLGPGLGLHQPENAPHWVETRGSRSISYTMVFETRQMRARGRARAANYYLRRLSLRPPRPSANPTADAIKSEAMRAVLPVRRTLADINRKVRQARG